MSFSLQHLALSYVDRGWPVLPLHTPTSTTCSCRTACQSPGKHPRIQGGVHSASLDKEKIALWWQQWPKANIGIATGSASDLIVIDIDERHGGIDSWRRFEKEHNVKTNLVAKTGGGFHLFFSGQGHRLKSRAGIMKGVDVRAENGYIVAAGSLHQSGTFYSWVSSDKGIPSPLPKPLLILLESGFKEQTTQSKSAISERRNDFLTRIAGLLRREACEEDTIFRGIEAINQAICSPLLPQEELKKIAQGMNRYEPKWKEITSPFFERPVPELDLKMLPQVMCDWAHDASERMQVPPDFFAGPNLVAFASVVGKQFSIYPKQEDTWQVIPNLWGGIIAKPGLFKTPAILEATSFVNKLAHQASAQYQEDCIRFEINSESIKAQIEGIKEAIKRSTREQKSSEHIDALEHRMQDLRKKLDEQNCRHKRFVVNDSTVEKLAVILQENPNGILLLRDELAGWATMLNRREGDREFYLESWNGSGSFTVDRIGRGTLHVPNLCLSIFGGIQPGKLDTLSNQMDGGSDGLLQRFQILLYPSAPKYWKNIDRKPHDGAYSALMNTFLKASQLSSLWPLAKNGVHFSMDAQEVFNDWREKHELRLRSDEIESDSFESHLSKYRSLVPTLALLFETMEALNTGRDTQRVELKSTNNAIAWCQYLERHAHKIYCQELSITQKSSRLLAKKIQNGAVKDGDSVRSIYRFHWMGLDTPEKLEKALSILEECGWLFIETIQNGSGKSKVIRLNPKALEFSIAG